MKYLLLILALLYTSSCGDLGVEYRVIDTSVTRKSAVQLSVGTFSNHGCVILQDSSLSCWGRGDEGQLGDGRGASSSTPVDNITLPGSRKAVQISAGYRHTCAILDNSSLSCWGYNFYGQIGDGSIRISNNRLNPVDNISLPDNRKAVQVSAGWLHTCAIIDNSSISCWGEGEYGQLGTGSDTDSSTPITALLPAGRTALKIAAGVMHNCAIMDNSSPTCWGTIATIN